MASEVYAKNTISGEVGLVPIEYLAHPIFGENLVEVRNSKRRKSLKDTVDESEATASETDGESAETEKKED